MLSLARSRRSLLLMLVLTLLASLLAVAPTKAETVDGPDLDVTFGVNGEIRLPELGDINTTDGQPHVVSMPDGRTVIGATLGEFWNRQGDFGVTRLTADGHLDPTFAGIGF